MENNYIGAIIGMIIVGVLFFFLYKDIKYDLTVVDTKVELVDGTIYECIEALPSGNNMTYIKLEDTRLVIPSKRIKIIEKIR